MQQVAPRTDSSPFIKLMTSKAIPYFLPCRLNNAQLSVTVECHCEKSGVAPKMDIGMRDRSFELVIRSFSSYCSCSPSLLAGSGALRNGTRPFEQPTTKSGTK